MEGVPKNSYEGKIIMRRKIVIVLLILMVVLVVIFFYLKGQLSLYSTSEFTVCNINNNFLEVSRPERVPVIQQNGDINVEAIDTFYQIDMEGIEIKDENNKKITLSDLKEGDLIEVTQRIEDNELPFISAGEVTYIEFVVSVKVLLSN